MSTAHEHLTVVQGPHKYCMLWYIHRCNACWTQGTKPWSPGQEVRLRTTASSIFLGMNHALWYDDSIRTWLVQFTQYIWTIYYSPYPSTNLRGHYSVRCLTNNHIPVSYFNSSHWFRAYFSHRPSSISPCISHVVTAQAKSTYSLQEVAPVVHTVCRKLVLWCIVSKSYYVAKDLNMEVCFQLCFGLSCEAQIKA